jgi:prevent-host-death family protein
MTGIVSASDLRKYLADILDQTEIGEDFIVTRQGVPVAHLIPFDPFGELQSSHALDSDMAAPPMLPMMDKMMEQVSQALGEREFDSLDEINAFLNDLLVDGSLPELKPETPLQEAQELIYQAWEEPSRKRRIKLAKQALDISADCADAYVLLAEEEARSLKKAIQYYKKAVAAGERALASEFDQLVGHFWGVIETRPYMRAREGLAYALWEQGNRRAAIEHAQEMLRLNPNDNQGVRHILVAWLLAEQDDDAVDALLQEYEDDISAVWQYSRALHRFRVEGASAASNRALAEAMAHNAHVPDYLSGKKRLPRTLPDFIGIGDENEAIAYVAQDGALWEREAGALAWLKEQAGAG